MKLNSLVKCVKGVAPRPMKGDKQIDLGMLETERKGKLKGVYLTFMFIKCMVLTHFFPMSRFVTVLLKFLFKKKGSWKTFPMIFAPMSR